MRGGDARRRFAARDREDSTHLTRRSAPAAVARGAFRIFDWIA
jgi:hypothetical protein